MFHHIFEHLKNFIALSKTYKVTETVYGNDVCKIKVIDLKNAEEYLITIHPLKTSR